MTFRDGLRSELIFIRGEPNIALHRKHELIAKYTIAQRQECISRDAVGELLEDREAAVNFFLTVS